MPEDAPRMSGTARLLLALGIAVLVIGALLVFFGVGAELTKPKTVTFTVQSDQVRRVITEQVKVGDPVFTDFGGMYIGRVAKVVISPDMRSVPDAQGRLHASPDPVRVQTDITIVAPGREGNGIVAVGSQVIQAGTQFSVISDKYVVKGSVVALSVR